MNPVAHRLAINNGTQCGYCSVGFVMNMSEFLVNNPGATKKEIEDAFDGNICRCTGYRAILTGMKTFASDWSAEDEKNRMKCLPDQECGLQNTADILIPFPLSAEGPLEPVNVEEGDIAWLTPTSIDEACAILKTNPDARLVHGNTSYGIYKPEYEASKLLVDLRLIDVLYDHSFDDSEIVIGAGVCYTKLIVLLEKAMDDWKDADTCRLSAAHFMALRTAGRIVRNAASIGGNSILVFKHIRMGEPFPSDLLTALDAIDAEIEFILVRSGDLVRTSVSELVKRIIADPEFADQILLLRYIIPRGTSDEISLAQKTALREVNSHSIVNATTRFRLGEDLVVEEAVFTLGGIAPYPWRPEKTISALKGRELSLENFGVLAQTLRSEISEQIEFWEIRMSSVIYEGISNAYRTDLAIGFLYKAIVHALNLRAPKRVPHKVASSGDITWGQWPVSDGRQYYKSQSYKQPVSEPFIKLMAMYQANGQVRYTHEYEVPPLTVNAAFVQSTKALADFYYKTSESSDAISTQDLRDYLSENYASFVDLITSEEVQIKDGRTNYQGMGLDQPIFSDGRVSYVGQSIALVLANSELDAIAIAKYVSEYCIGYRTINWTGRWKEPVLDLLDAIKINSIFPDSPKQATFVSHIWRIKRPGSQMNWTKANQAPWDRNFSLRHDVQVQGNKCTVVENTQQTGGKFTSIWKPNLAWLNRPRVAG